MGRVSHVLLLVAVHQERASADPDLLARVVHGVDREDAAGAENQVIDLGVRGPHRHRVQYSPPLSQLGKRVCDHDLAESATVPTAGIRMQRAAAQRPSESTARRSHLLASEALLHNGVCRAARCEVRFDAPGAGLGSEVRCDSSRGIGPCGGGGRNSRGRNSRGRRLFCDLIGTSSCRGHRCRRVCGDNEGFAVEPPG